MNVSETATGGRKLLQLGILLFLLGLLSGFAVPMLANPRMGLSSHLEGVMNGMMLMVLGLTWPHLHLSAGLRKVALVLLVFGTYVNWATTLGAAAMGAGGSMMPIAAAQFVGSEAQEALISVGLISLSVAMLVGCGIVAWGLRGPPATP